MAGGGSRTGCGPSGGWAGGVCVSVAARGREAMAPPPPAARSAARGPPGRAHCSRPESTGLPRRPESFRGSAPAPPSACGARGLEGGSGAVVELTPGLTRGARRSAPWGWGGAPRADNPPSFGTWHRVGLGIPSRPHIPGEPPPAPEYLLLPPRATGSPWRRRWGRGPLCLFCWLLRVLTPGCICRNLWSPLCPSAPQPWSLFRIVPLLEKSPSYSQR